MRQANLSQCVEAMRKYGLNGLLISNPLNITYLTGFRQAEGYLLITQDARLIYFTNFIYEYEARKHKIWTTKVSRGNMFKLIAQETNRCGLTCVGFEAKHLPFLEEAKIKEYLSDFAIDLVQTIDIVEGIRVVKNRQEIACIQKSVAVSLQAFEFVKEIYDQSTSEKILASEIEKFLTVQGDGQVAFPTIVACGKNSALAHHIPGADRLNSKCFLIDLGARYCGYCADLTRVFFWDKMPLLFRRVYDVVRKAQELSIQKIKDGVRARDVDKIARTFIDKKGFGKYFGHGLGHGIGLEVHEAPFLNAHSETILKDGMVVTVEPAIYLDGKFGVRIEDVVLVTKNGRKVLSATQK
ncbi:MAG: Xaa-Pro peptidase family protein [Candidatus Omnitrophota bacterium]